MSGYNQWHRTIHTGQGCPFPVWTYKKVLGSADVNVQCHNLPKGETNSYNILEITKTMGIMTRLTTKSGYPEGTFSLKTHPL